jgi:hypothetical protein
MELSIYRPRTFRGFPPAARNDNVIYHLGAWSHEVADTKLARHVKIAGPDGEGTAG